MVTGFFGDLTEAAVKRFQEKYGIEKTGIVDSKTMEKLNGILNNWPVDWSFPRELILAIVAQESGPGGHPDYTFSNEFVSYDYGHGVMQITFRPMSSDVKYLQVVLNSDPDTQVATSGDGSPGKETHNFGPLTKIAVEKFQKKYNLPEYDNEKRRGKVYFPTRTKLNELLENNRESFRNKGIPLDFNFEEFLFEGRKDIIKEDATFDLRGEGSRVNIPPCTNVKTFNWEDKNYFKHCYQYDDKSGYFEYKEYKPHRYYNNQILKYYTNTSQGIYANIKDGLRVLQEKYKARCPKESIYREGYEFTCRDIEKILMTWGYNGIVITDRWGDSYLYKVSVRLKNLADYFGIVYPNTDNLIEKLEIASRHQRTIKSYSPVEIQVIDSQGRITGIIEGEIREEIPNSGYDKDTKNIGLLFPENNHLYQIVGTEDGSYGLEIINVENETTATFTAIDIPISTSTVHQYQIDWQALSQGEKGATLQIDVDGDGVFEKTITADNDLTYDEFILQTETIVDFDPDTLNLKSKGQWITAYIELPEGYDPALIDATAVLLNGIVPAVTDSQYDFVTNPNSYLIDYDSDGILERMVKFERDKVQALFPEPVDSAILTLTGKILYNADLINFGDSDIIRVIDKGGSHQSADPASVVE